MAHTSPHLSISPIFLTPYRDQIAPANHTHSTTPLLTLTFIQTPAPPAPNARPKKEPEFVSIHLLLLRLAAQTTDLLITINVPHYPGEYVKAEEGGNGVTQLMRDGETVKKKVLESFEVKDWKLFEG